MGVATVGGEDGEPDMRALVVYESVFGNTAAVARALGEGLARHGQVTVADVRGARPEYAERFDLLVVGAPARAFRPGHGITRPEPDHPDRPDFLPGRPERGLRDWLWMLPADPHSEAVATFDVRPVDPRLLPGSTAGQAAQVLEHLGYVPATEPTSFYVKQPGGPLVPGERARAAVWGDGLGALLRAGARGRSARN